MLEQLLSALKHRMHSQSQMHRKIEAKTKIIQELHRDTELLKEELIRRNGGNTGQSSPESQPD